MKYASIISAFSGLVLWCLLFGCGGTTEVQRVDPYLLLTEGRYAEARAAVVKDNTKDPKSRAIVAISLAAEDPSEQNGASAVRALTDDTGDSDILPTLANLLNLTFYIPQPVSTQVSLRIAEVALGALGQGPLATPDLKDNPVGDGTRRLAVFTLERVNDALEQPRVAFESNRILAIWEGCSALMGAAFAVTDDAQAWLLFDSLGGIAVVVEDAAPNSDLSLLLLDSVVVVLESNPEIAIAARCDLSSPFDDLRLALAHKRNLAGRLEAATSGAVGCTRGTYAPGVR